MEEIKTQLKFVNMKMMNVEEERDMPNIHVSKHHRRKKVKKRMWHYQKINKSKGYICEKGRAAQIERVSQFKLIINN